MDIHVYEHKKGRAWILVGLVLLLAAVVLYFKYCRPEREDATLQAKVDSLQFEIYIRELQVDSIDKKNIAYVDTLEVVRKENKRLKSSYVALLAEKKEELEKIEVIPTNKLYSLLVEEVYPDEGIKHSFLFTEHQIKSFYFASQELKYAQQQIPILNARLSNTGRLVASQDTLLAGQKEIIARQEQIISFQEEQLTIKDKQIKMGGKRIKNQRLMGIAIGVGAFLAGMFIGGN